MTSKDKLKMIDHLKNDIYCRVGVSKISGVGVIAIKNIPKGVDPFKTLSKYNDPIIELRDEDLISLPKNVKNIVNDFFGNVDMSSGKKRKIYDILASGPNNINISFYMNHSDDPNISIIEVEGSAYLEFVTNKEVKVGKELTIDYEQYNN